MDSIRNGSWLTHERVTRVAWLFLAVSILSLVWLLATSKGTLDALGRPLGTDFSNVWTAGTMVLDGRAAQVWSWPDHFAVQRAFQHKADVDTFGWHYPPPFLLIATLLAAMPYLVALAVWQAATLGPLAAMLWRYTGRRDADLLTLAAPVTLICVTHGHNGFLTGLLLGGGLILLDRRPFVAGLLFGCLVYKPQFALIIPPLLLAAREWRAIAGAITSAGILIGITLIAWGWPVWDAFIESLPLTQHIVIEQGATGWHKIMSPFSAVRMWGGGVSLAYAVQGLFTLACVIGVAWLAWTKRGPGLRNAFVCAAVLISTPYVLDYDYVVLLPALAFLWRDGEAHGFADWDKSLMALAWAIPIVGRQAAENLYVPLGLASALILAGIALRRALRASPSRRSREAFAQ